MAPDRRRRRPLAVMLSILTVIGALALPAIAAPPGDDGPKTYTASIDPAHDVCVDTVETFTLTLVNTSAQQQLGSADVTPAFAVDSVASVTVDGGSPDATAVLDGATIALRDLAAAPGATIELVFEGSSDTAGAHVVGVVAKQANDFKGNPGNDLTLAGDPASVTFSDAGDCAPPYVFDDTCVEGELCEWTTPHPVDGLIAAGFGKGGEGGGGLILNAATRSGDSYVCGAYEGDEFARIPATVEAIGVNLSGKVVAFQVDKKVDQASVNNGASFYQVCATPQAPFSEFSSFVDVFGNTVANPDDPGAPDGPSQTSGFLPDCSTTGDVAPCVISRTKTKAGDVLIRVRWGSGFRFG